jgi:hypothetical protein
MKSPSETPKSDLWHFCKAKADYDIRVRAFLDAHAWNLWAQDQVMRGRRGTDLELLQAGINSDIQYQEDRT